MTEHPSRYPGKLTPAERARRDQWEAHMRDVDPLEVPRAIMLGCLVTVVSALAAFVGAWLGYRYGSGRLW